MSWFWTVMFLSFAFTSISESKPQKPSAVVVGTVYCDTCFLPTLPRASQYFLAGASVAVECTATRSGTSFRQEVKTDSHGEFRVHLPFPVSKHVRRIRGCSVRLISSNKPYCAVAASATSSNLHLKLRKDGTHVFSAGFFTFRPLKQPEVCDMKPRMNKKPVRSNEILSQISNPNDPAFLPPIQDPPSDPPSLGSFLPPLPRLPPLPQLPRLPPLPGLPFLPPIPKKQLPNKDPKLSDSVVNQPTANTFPFPQNPFSPPTSGIFPPNPFQPPSTFPPNPFQPPSTFPPAFPPLLRSPPLFNLPSIPGLITSPPSPSLPTPLPPFPFQPTPGFPGVPHAEVSSSSETSSP